ncbi:MAG: penicillin-binding protein 2 [Omnitrophica WOR_2 bacterium RBG_13_41_10]|nr:MAG: penicillin-binding protein 2 [Omnitrophica WOR_2 bacterium RBG_13_41_10]
MRIKAAKIIIALLFLFLLLGVANLELIQGKKFRDLSKKNCIRLLPQMGSRGKILDRRGDVIIGNFLSYDVMLMPQDEGVTVEALAKISQILATPVSNLRNNFKRNFIAPFAPVIVANNISMKKAIALEELKLDFNLDNVIIQPHPQREYPFLGLACHSIGHLNEIDHWRLSKLADYGYEAKDIVGFTGIEEKFDYYLRQEEGGLSFEVDHRGRFVRLLGFRPPKSGKDIQLTLDLKVQKIVERSLNDRKGCVIIMNPYSGEIIALASSPNFNPELFMKQDPAAGRILNNPDAPLVNRAISGLYPAGSMFKLVVATAALETNKINLATTFVCTGSTRVGREDFACWDTHGPQNVMKAIPHSCNVFFYKTGLLVGPQLIYDYALKLGLARPTAIDLPYEAGGFIPNPLWKRINKFKNWFNGDTANLAIGQGDVQVTPLQIARMMAVFANRGSLVTPYIVGAIDGQDISLYKRKSIRLAFKQTTLDSIRQGLRNAIADASGTGNVLSNLAVSVAGKTGTAQAGRGQPHGWFAGFFPYKNPKFVICTFLEHGGSGYMSCVVTKQILEEMAREGLI